jgi:hypothetical protein
MLKYIFVATVKCFLGFVFLADGWKHIHLGINMETGGCGCSLKELLMMGTIVTETC